jgi:hypothetical protein
MRILCLRNFERHALGLFGTLGLMKIKEPGNAKFQRLATVMQPS